MGRKKIHHTIKISQINREIAMLELLGKFELAEGFKNFFLGVYSEQGIEEQKAELAASNARLAQNYRPKTLPPDPENSTKKPKKTGTVREIRTIRNRAGKGGKTYKWAYEVTYQDGKRVRSRSIGMVSDDNNFFDDTNQDSG